ncbi:MAG: mercury methylation corrinoid protein HgcA [Candidatus Coatesbacteria bacterium]
MTGAPFVTGRVSTPAGEVPRASTALSWRDHWGTLFVRLAMGRMAYTVEPGLYAVGSPSPESPVLVSANYKLSFDHLRSRLGGLDAWILVLDTKGINVWCAAGKGTFGTDEIVRRVAATRLAEVVTGRRLILPQLGAPGVSAHEVTRQTRFGVVYGPVRAADIPEFLRAGMKATPGMRRVRFGIRDRAVLIPVELVIGAKLIFGVASVMVLLGGLVRWGYSVDRAAASAPGVAALALAAFAFPVVLVPLLLPWLPGRAFAVKGAWVGAAMALGLYLAAHAGVVNPGGRLELWGWMAGWTALASYVAMNFTGASTYTSLSGVYAEMKRAIPAQAVLAAAAAVLWISGRLAGS